MKSLSEINAEKARLQAEIAAITMRHLGKHTEPCMIEAGTGFGKSHLIKLIAEHITKRAPGKRILCLAPSKELVEQNHAKYIQIAPASIYCASAGVKCLRNDVVFCSPQTLANKIDQIAQLPIAAIIIDEAQNVIPTIRRIIDTVRLHNPNIRVIGLDATPYTMRKGYTYRVNERGRILGKEETVNPYFDRLVYKISTQQLVDMGMLTQPAFPEIVEHYDTSGLIIDKKGDFTAESLRQTFDEDERMTRIACLDIVRQSKDRKGVLVFASSIKHAQDCVQFIGDDTAIITGTTPKKEREKIVNDFKKKQIKYLVNVGCLTTGFDAEHCDVIAVLRATESPGLFMQIIGRGTRLCEGKTDFLILDYGENFERHGLTHEQPFNPEIKAASKKSNDATVAVLCECGFVNQFKAKPNPDNLSINSTGYFVDLTGKPLEIAHYGRKCQAEYETGSCGHLFVYKECPHCGHQNDIAARACGNCFAELINVDDKLSIDHIADYTRVIPVMKITEEDHNSKAGNQCKKVTFFLANGENFIKYYSPHSQHPFPQLEWREYNRQKMKIKEIKQVKKGDKWELKKLIY